MVQILDKLLEMCADPHGAISAGTMIREALKCPGLPVIVIARPRFWDITDQILNPAFEISSDAFSTLKDTLTRDPSGMRPYLVDNVETFAAKIGTLLNSDNYLVKRQW